MILKIKFQVNLVPKHNKKENRLRQKSIKLKIFIQLKKNKWKILNLELLKKSNQKLSKILIN